MGYFPNGTANDIYREKYCNQCFHDRNGDCPIVLLHLVHNYDECNNEHSFLHALIPRNKTDCDNEECKLFVPNERVRPELETSVEHVCGPESHCDADCMGRAK
jgi:hypothetical protein